MKHFDWNKEKNKKLAKVRGVSFEDVVEAINAGKLIDTIKHPNREKYPNQKIYIVNIKSYIYMVPFVEDKYKKFLKTIFPNRKMRKKYLVKK